MTTLPLFAVGDAALFVGSALGVQAGEVHHAESLFPPPPSTFQGALRSRLLSVLGVDLRGPVDRAAVVEAIGPPERLLEGWSIDGPWAAGVELHDGDEVLMPWTRVPLCAFASRRSDDHPSRSAPRQPAGEVTWKLRRVCERPPRLLLDEDASEALVRDGPVRTPSWMSADHLWSLLSTGTVKAPRHADPPFARAESRVGLKLDGATRTASTGQLYFQRKVRLGGLPGTVRAGLAAWLEVPTGTRLSASQLHRGHLQVGRRATPLALEPMPRLATSWTKLTRGTHLQELPADRLRDGMEVWLLLASPVALFDTEAHGAPTRPRLPVFPPCRLEVTAAVLDHPLRIGGIDLANHGRPKPVLPYLPAGCAWRLRISGGTPDDRRAALLELHHRCTLGEPGARTFGFGRTWIALPPEEPS